MARNTATSAAVDRFLQFLVAGGVLTTTLMAPNAVQALDKPLRLFDKKMEKRARDREYQRVLTYMTRQRLVNIKSGKAYITARGHKRVKRAAVDSLAVDAQQPWDGKWRLVFYDVPESSKTARNLFCFRIKRLGLIQLQKSVWVYPYPCQKEVLIIADYCGLNQCVNFAETDTVNSQAELTQRFNLSSGS